MRNPGPTINGQRNPEGYITGYPVSASRETNNKILIEIDELPVTAAVTLELEELSIDLSTHPSLEIGVRLEEKFSATKLIYRADSSSRDNHTETQTVTLKVHSHWRFCKVKAKGFFCLAHPLASVRGLNP